MSPEKLKATVEVEIEHVQGPVVEDGEQIRWWLAGKTVLCGDVGGFDFQVCSGHARPWECPEDCGRSFALYRAEIRFVYWDGQK